MKRYVHRIFYCWKEFPFAERSNCYSDTVVVRLVKMVTKQELFGLINLIMLILYKNSVCTVPDCVPACTVWSERVQFFRILTDISTCRC